MKEYKAKIKSAEEITGVEGCVSFVSKGIDYVSEMNPTSPEEEYEFEESGLKHDRLICTKNKYYYKKEWLKDIREEIDWSKVSVDTKCLVSNDGEYWHKRYFSHVDGNGVPVFFMHGATSWTQVGCEWPWKYYKLAEEPKE